MGYSVGRNSTGRDIGYGVPAFCDSPSCKTEIDRGMDYLCGDFQEEEKGCGLYFCSNHTFWNEKEKTFTCMRCLSGKDAYREKPDHPDWARWKLTDESWKKWRKENPDEVKKAWTVVNRFDRKNGKLKKYD